MPLAGVPRNMKIAESGTKASRLQLYGDAAPRGALESRIFKRGSGISSRTRLLPSHHGRGPGEAGTEGCQDDKVTRLDSALLQGFVQSDWN